MLRQLADGVTVTDLQPCIALADVCGITPAVRSSPSGKLLTAVHQRFRRATRQDEEITLGVSPLVVP